MVFEDDDHNPYESIWFLKMMIKILKDPTGREAPFNVESSETKATAHTGGGRNPAPPEAIKNHMNSYGF